MSDQPEHTTTSARRTKPDELRLPGMLCGATIVVAAFALLAVAMNALKDHLPRIGPGYEQWLSTVAANDVLARIQWAIGDMTEPQFYKSWLASLGLLAGAAIAWWAGTRNKRWAGMPISYGKGVWPWILGFIRIESGIVEPRLRLAAQRTHGNPPSSRSSASPRPWCSSTVADGRCSSLAPSWAQSPPHPWPCF